jgi:hypothetical protein
MHIYIKRKEKVILFVGHESVPILKKLNLLPPFQSFKKLPNVLLQRK